MAGTSLVDSGVQARHYDRYSYLEEKRRALLKWNRYLEQVVEGGDAARRH